MKSAKFALLCLVATICAPMMAFGAVPFPGQAPVENIDFEKHLMGLFSKAGCNSGSCHGSFQGKNGFRLSLFGYDPERDIQSLVRESSGRRINVMNPDESLMLLKATGRVPHEGAVRLSKDSWQYQMFRAWIAGGAKWTKGSGTVQSLRHDAGDFAFVEPGQTKPIKVFARFADGPEEEITAFCDFKVSDEAVAEVATTGEVTARQPGDTGLVISYRGMILGLRVLVPAQLPKGIKYPQVSEVNFVDKEVFAKLRRLNMIPAELSSDTEFLRRVTIDTLGTLPTPDEIRSFVADQSPDKRAKKIDELLAHPLHAAVWATKFSDITGNNTENTPGIPQPLRARYSQMWHDWFRKRIQDNVPYDQIVRGVLTATSRDGLEAKEWVDAAIKLDEQAGKGFESNYPDRKSLDLFWKQQGLTLEARGEKVAAAFLGVRLECAQCHKHPTDRWTQADYRAFGNLFQQVTVGASPECREMVNKVNNDRREAAGKNRQVTQLREVFIASAPPNRNRGGRGIVNPNALRHPDTNEPLAPKALGGPEYSIESNTDDCREKLLQWMSQPDNPYFARSFVNRVWAHYFGVGLVEPVDDFSVANPPSNAKLLTALAKEFIDHKFDIRHIERVVLNSRSYQLSSAANATNKTDRNNYARSYLRPMLAETVVDVLNAALGVKESFGNEAPNGANMIEVGASRLNNGNLNYVLRIFGRPPRTTACDCERTFNPALPQTLYRMTDPSVMQKLNDRNGRLAQLLKDNKSDDEILDELFLATLSRLPKDAEREAFNNHRGDNRNRQAVFQDTLWALINTREFILNH